MDFIMNFPFFSIVLSLFSAVVCFAFQSKKARFVTYALLSVSILLSVCVILYNLNSETGYFVYRMGHYDAPIGNEISAGLLEPFFALLFEVVILSSLLGGEKRIFSDIDESKHRLFYVMTSLTHAALVALCYTNDIFTAYVFVEVCTIASCSLLMAKSSGRSLVAATRYMFFSLIGSGLLLVGIILIYAITGHLLFPQIFEAINNLWITGNYYVPLIIAIGLMVSGLAIKSGLFPFHLWMPDTYGTATPAASGILSGVISKGYIFLLCKILFRAIGFDVFEATGIQNILLAFGICGIIFGSISAIRTNNINFMTAYSSAAQIGYIYMGLGIGSNIALMAAMLQIVAHALTKPLLFLAAGGLSDTVDGKQTFAALRSSAHNNRAAGVAYTVGALSMVGIPLFAGFVPKLLFAISAFDNGAKTYFVLIALSISTILNVVYFLRTLINIYGPEKLHIHRSSFTFKKEGTFAVVVVVMTLLNVLVGLQSQPILSLLEKGIDLFINIH